MKIAYIAGPYRAESYEGIKKNIAHAQRVAIKYWMMGYAVICPHMNSAHLDGVVQDEQFLKADLKILERCDVVVAMRTWNASVGAKAEIERAESLEMEIIYDETL